MLISCLQLEQNALVSYKKENSVIKIQQSKENIISPPGACIKTTSLYIKQENSKPAAPSSTMLIMEL